MSDDGNLGDRAQFYDAAWLKEQSSRFEDYPRNLLLASIVRDWNGIGRTMIDVGCGPGIVAAHFAKLGYSVSGVDASPVAVAKAFERLPGSSFFVGDVEKPLPFQSASADVVFWGDNAEHLFKPERTLREIRRILKTSGQLILTCPNTGHWKSRLIYLLRGAMARSEGYENPPWAWEHIRFFTPEILRAFLNTEGFEVTHLTGTLDFHGRDFLARRFPSLFSSILLAVARPANEPA